jgi:hypothetical protein
MNSIVDDVLREADAAGIHLLPDPPDLIVTPEERLTPELEERLRNHKPEILRRLEFETSMQLRKAEGELEASMRRLEAADVLIAVWDDGSVRVIQSDIDSQQARADAGTVYTPQDMYYFVLLTTHERRMLHEFKERFGGSVEWQRTGKNTLEDKC